MTGAALDAHIVVTQPNGFQLDVSLRMEPGEVVAMMGPSGAGKSTLLAAIAGLQRISAGAITIDGREVASARSFVAPAKRGVVLLGQEPRLFPHLTARANVAFGLRAQGLGRDEAGRRADGWLDAVGLDDMGGRRPAELSGGQQQRVAVARALAIDPRILLLDEPFTSLDPHTASDIRALLHDQLLATRATAVIVTHDVVDAVAVADRLLFLDDGALTQSGSVREVLAAPETGFAATIAGVNRVEGRVIAGRWSAAGFALDAPAPAPTSAPEGAMLAAVFHPSAVRLAPEISGEGGARADGADGADGAGGADAADSRWSAHVMRLEQAVGGVRVHTSAPEVVVDVSVEDAAVLHLAPGTPVTLSISRDHVRLQIVGGVDTPAVADDPVRSGYAR